MRKGFLLAIVMLCGAVSMAAAERFVTFERGGQTVCLTEMRGEVRCDPDDWKGVLMAVENLRKDFVKVTGRCDLPIVVGTLGRSRVLDELAKERLADGRTLRKMMEKELKGKREKFVITMAGGRLVVAGSDKRGTIYGVYELCEQIGVSPWYDWADVSVEKREHIYINKGVFTDGEPAVRYRGIFLNDEAPCLSGWVNANYGGVYNHEFYARVFELVLRLKGNFMWPAMWNSAFYSDDPLNMQTADDMGVMMGTSHHEPMARAHKEWTRDKSHGAWNYDTNREELDAFWRGGVERMRETEDVVTIGMRGNGDEPMGENADVELLERIVKSQRRLIEEATGRPAEETPQVWALYKEVQEYYEKGMQVPDDVILLLCDDNWGNVRILPELDGAPDATGAFAKRHKGGYGMYYHVDYVGGPRNSKWLNVTQIQRLWEQMQLTYTYGVDKLWILNVGDLKPMEFPIDFWFRMAWNPAQFNASNLQEYTEAFCRQQLGEQHAKEAARLLNLQCKYAHRRTAELLDRKTYSIETGEWNDRVEDYNRLEHDAALLWQALPAERRDTYNQLIYFPIRAMANLYNMYFAQAMNHLLAEKNDPRANEWADRVEQHFRRDAELCDEYNHTIAGGKWNHLMDEIHIGYKSWNNPPRNICPEVKRVDAPTPPVQPLIAVVPRQVPVNKVVIEADDFSSKTDADGASWQVIPDFGVHRSGVALMPYTRSTEGASITYTFNVPFDMDNATLTLVLAPTFPFNGGRGQRLAVAIDGTDIDTLNVNEASRYIRDGYRDQNYEWETTRQNRQTLRSLPRLDRGSHSLTLRPLDPGIVVEQIVIDQPLPSSKPILRFQ